MEKITADYVDVDHIYKWLLSFHLRFSNLGLSKDVKYTDNAHRCFWLEK